ncbi:hypothetical protein ACIPLC_26815 [Kitasatospora sp. NPDC086801]|uniref:hypothetical protein n=1 Tax=Kitasatospora sp. NPDC086801 TaxID=3364066 RepID=UPI00381ACE1F
MSAITTILLSPGGWEEDADVVAELNVRLHPLSPEVPGRWQLRNIATRDHAWGGTKWPPDVYGGALNHLPFAEFARIVGELPWSEPELFQLFVMAPDEGSYRVLTLADLRTWPTD